MYRSLREGCALVLVFASVGACDRALGSGGPDGGIAARTGADAAQRGGCTSDSDCATGFCSDGICCDRRCNGTCEACARTYTGIDDGVCGPVVAGIDPYHACADETVIDACAQDGECNGAGACRKAARGRECAPAACVDAHTFASAGICDGTGLCVAGARIDCGAYACSGTGCAKACADDPGCPNGTYCANGTCQVRRSNGNVCAANVECASGFCSPDRICCEQACAGTCMACFGGATGRPDGTCAPVRQGSDPRGDCPADPAETCGRNGSCDGTGSCALYGVDTVCAPARCDPVSGNASATLTPAAQCDGHGACAAVTSAPCPGSVLCLSDRECRPTVCTGDGDCISGFYCDARACTAQKTIGTTCAASDQCASGFCSESWHGDAVCCSSSCPLSCQGCTSESTGLATGTCAPRLANATAVCGGICASGYGLCSSGLSCQPTVWTFDGEPPDASLPFGWGPDDMSAVHPSSQWNHTPGGSGALAVVAGTPWDAAPGIVLCGRDPDNGDSPTMDLGGRTLDAWILRDGPPTLLNGACLFVIQHPDGAFEEPRGIEFDANEIDVWRELSLTVSLATPYVWKVAIRCVMEDGWPGTLYIDDVSIR